MEMRSRQHVAGMALLVLGFAAPAAASFSGTEVVIPSVGRGPGAQQSQWYTTVWIHNPGTQVAAVQVYFLERGTSNPSPRVKQVQVPPEVTYRITNAVESLFNLTNSFGAFRIVASQKVYVNARIYSQAAGDTEAETVGQFFAATPASFALGAGQTTEVLGVYQTNPQSASLYRYNFGLVETAGGNATVHVDAANQTGGYVGSKDYPLGPFGALQVNIKDLLPAVNSDNLRLHVTVQPGSSGKVIAYGSGLANQSNDPSTFEMQYRDELLAGGGGGLTMVDHDATLQGDGTAAHPLGVADEAISTAKLSASGSTAGQVLTSDGSHVAWQTPTTGGSGLSAVAHDATLSGSGTNADVLRIAAGGVGATQLADGAVSYSKLADAAVGNVKLAAGAVSKDKIWATGSGTSGQVLGTNGADLVWQTPASGGLTLPYSGEVTSTEPAFFLDQNGLGRGLLVSSMGDALAAFGGAGFGVVGTTNSGLAGVYGVVQTADIAGVWGANTIDGPGVLGMASMYGDGVHGKCTQGVGVRGVSVGNYGVLGESTDGEGVAGKSSNGDGLFGEASAANRSGVFALTTSPSGYAGAFNGRVVVHGDLHVDGNISKGGGSFRIDHPLDPENRYLSHSFVESPDMKNVYDGVVTTDENGLAVVLLPGWFEVLNRDFRYQLTVIGRFAQAIVLREIEGNAFTIQTNLADVKVSWQVTGIRRDPYAEKHRIAVEEDKPERERGTYLHPDAYGQPEEKGIEWVRHPEIMQRLKADREKAAPPAK